MGHESALLLSIILGLLGTLFFSFLTVSFSIRIFSFHFQYSSFADFDTHESKEDVIFLCEESLNSVMNREKFLCEESLNSVIDREKELLLRGES